MATVYSLFPESAQKTVIRTPEHTDSLSLTEQGCKKMLSLFVYNKDSHEAEVLNRKCMSHIDETEKSIDKNDFFEVIDYPGCYSFVEIPKEKNKKTGTDSLS